MKRSRRLFLEVDYDHELVKAQMRIKTVEGFTYRFRKGVPISPKDIIGEDYKQNHRNRSRKPSGIVTAWAGRYLA